MHIVQITVRGVVGRSSKKTGERTLCKWQHLCDTQGPHSEIPIQAAELTLHKVKTAWMSAKIAIWKEAELVQLT